MSGSEAHVESLTNRAAKFGLVFIIVSVLLISLYLFAALHFNYSEGERAGFVQKLSKKGWLCKTWEGEMALVSLPGAAPEKFYFTVQNDKIAERINTQVGSRVALVFAQHKGLFSSCFGETEYFVTDFKVILPQ